jgi:Fe-S-cluster containining protein
MHMDYPAYLQGSDTQPAEEHWTNLPEALKEELLKYIADYQEPAKGELGKPCVWLDLQTRRCKHHQHRPKVCRDFKTGSPDCLGWRREYFDERR